MNSHELVENRKMKVLLFGFIDMNSMDGSAVFLSSLASTIALDSNIEVDLLLASPVKRDILIQPLEKFDNITILNPFVDPFFEANDDEWVKKGVIDFDIAEMLISHYWSQKGYDWLFVRSIETVEKIAKHKHIIKNTLVYATGLTHIGQDVNEEKFESIKNIYDQCAYFLCQTEEMCEFVIEILNLNKEKNKVSLLTPMIPNVESAEGQNRLKNKLVYTGKFDPDWKTIPIITAFKELKREIPNLSLDVAGDKFKWVKEDSQFKEEAAYLLKNTDGLTWYGALTRENAQQLIVNGDIGITWRSVEMDSSLELSTKLLEYGILRKAVIMNPTEMHIKLFGEDYPLYAVTEKDFRDAVKLALCDKDIYEFAAQRMYQVSRQFLFSEAIKKLQGLLWSKRITDYVNESTDMFYIDEDDFDELNQHTPSKKVKKLPAEFNVDEVFTYIVKNIPEEIKRVEKLFKLSGYGQIISAGKAGCYTFFHIHKSYGNFEQNFQKNMPYLNTIGFETYGNPKLKPKDVEISMKERAIVDNKNTEIKVKNKELVKEVKKLKKLNTVQLKQITKLEKQNLALGRKYDSLSKSKMGKMTFKYWDIRKRLNF
ncbi:glycosyltransferase [Bacillus sp. ISL-4]|uniref:glycosyltransferase n=1 Tax=Bacillus sp. ISL-4 TaxID=2819125 RepID=UPI001BECB0E0|nr:glycosyltransferase [Bacillus sp. ISL-4]MBT2668718.1 glycosyltransferase [Bacillus sp. ISL-4]MBT2673023.1 glycosyltransferase [Streptomyces sp. ISL-14]